MIYLTDDLVKDGRFADGGPMPLAVWTLFAGSADPDGVARVSIAWAAGLMRSEKADVVKAVEWLCAQTPPILTFVLDEGWRIEDFEELSTRNPAKRRELRRKRIAKSAGNAFVEEG